jgi:hypothetical protein
MCGRREGPRRMCGGRPSRRPHMGGAAGGRKRRAAERTFGGGGRGRWRGRRCAERQCASRRRAHAARRRGNVHRLRVCHGRRGAPRPTGAVRRSCRCWRWRSSLLRSRQRVRPTDDEPPARLGRGGVSRAPTSGAGAWVGAAAQGAAQLRPASSARRTRGRWRGGRAACAAAAARGKRAAAMQLRSDDARGE